MTRGGLLQLELTGQGDGCLQQVFTTVTTADVFQFLLLKMETYAGWTQMGLSDVRQ